MELIKPKQVEMKKNDILYIKHYHHVIDIGGDSTCYNLSYKQVIKLFDMSYFDPNDKLFLPHEHYGNDTFIFVDDIRTYCNKIIAYTMAYIKGARLGKTQSMKMFYELSFEMLEQYLSKIINDCSSIANNGIKVFDSFETNIILSDTGFKHIDSIDFYQEDKDPENIKKENIQLMCNSIWDSLIAPVLFKFIMDNKLNEHDFATSPIEVLKEMKALAQNYTNNPVRNLSDVLKLSRRK